MRTRGLDPIQGQGHGASKVAKIAFSRPISSAIFAWISKLMVDGDSMGPGLQLVGVRFMNFLLGNLS